MSRRISKGKEIRPTGKYDNQRKFCHFKNYDYLCSVKISKPMNANFEYFKKNLSELYKKYPDRYLVLKDEEVKFDGATFEEALTFATENGFELGTFLIQQCGADSSCYTQVFHTRAIFA